MAYGKLSQFLMGAPQMLGPVPPGGLRGGGSLAQLLAPGLDMGGGMGQGQFPTAPGSASPFTPEPFDLFAPENALPLAGQLIGANSNAEGIGNALMMGGGLYGKHKSRNKSMSALSGIDPQMAAFAEAGAPLDELWKATLAGGASKPTDDQREYAAAVAQGFPGTFMEYQIKMKEAGRNQIDINTGEKLPTGFRWKNPEQKELGVEPIPGGPGEQVPSELAARVGMADNFLSQLPDIKARVRAGEVTGVYDKTSSSLGFGTGSHTYRQIQSGVDALTRMLSGAGMNMTEAEQYASRYLPTYADDSTSMLKKLDQLEGELKATKEMTMRGRGGVAPQSGGTTSGGVQWSIEP